LNTAFNYDGTKMYISYYDNNNTNFVPPEQFDLSTPWDVSTAVPRVKKLYLGDQETEPHGIYVKPDGTKFYIIGSAGDDVNEYNMSTPFDVSTGVFSQKFSVGAQELTPYGIEFKPDGTKMYVVGASWR
jgi:DNA-binding beta-propeller fold protein YncE